MIAKYLNPALKALQTSMYACARYAPDHPVVERGLTLASECLHEALRLQPEIVVLCFEQKVVVGDSVLEASGELASGLFGRMAECGVESIAFRRGLDRSALAEFIRRLTAEDSDGERPRPIPGITFGYVAGARESEDDSQTPDPHSDLDADALSPARVEQVLTGVLDSVATSGRYDNRALGDLVGTICTSVTIHAGTLLPLAQLKRFDEYTYVHTLNVSVLAAALGEAVGLKSGALQDLTAAALLHDIGKREVPVELLNKQGKLENEELDVVRLHPVNGARLLFEIDEVPDLAPIVAYEHHLHLDGSGYPNRRRAWNLSLASKVVQVADVFDALRTHRPYRAALSHEQAIEILAEGAGDRYDADLIQVFIDRVASLCSDDPSRVRLLRGGRAA